MGGGAGGVGVGGGGGGGTPNATLSPPELFLGMSSDERHFNVSLPL